MKMTVAMLAAVCGLAATAQADLPPAMDKAPDTAMGIVAVRNMSALHGRLMRFVEIFEADVEGSPIAMMGQMLSTPGLAKDGSAMVVLLAPAEGPNAEGQKHEHAEGEEHDHDHSHDNDPRPVVVVPVTDAKAFTQALNAQGTGVMTAEFDGQTVFLKDGGSGYVFMSPVEGVVDTFKLGSNASAGLKKAMGSSGAKSADTADVVVYLTAALANEGMQAGTGALQGQAEMMDMMAGPEGGNPLKGATSTAKDAAEAFEKEGQAVVMSLTMDDAGVVFDVIGQFREGTEHAKMFQVEGKASELTKTYPASNFLLAGSFDMSSELVRGWMKQASELQREQGADAQLAGIPMEKFTGLYDDVEGFSMFVGIPPAGLMGGMLTASSAFYQTKDPAKLSGQLKTALEALNDVDVEGMKFKSTYKAQSVEAEGKKFDSWQVVVPNMNDPNAQQAMMMIWGMGPGPSGLIGQADKGVVITMGSNSQNMTSALKAASGGESMYSKDEFSAVAKRLPSDRVFEGYLGVKGVIDMVGPFIAMQTGGAPFKTPEKLSPIALAGTMNGGALGFRAVVPNDVIEVISDIAAEMAALEGGDDEMMDEGEEAPAEGENRPPRF